MSNPKTTTPAYFINANRISGSSEETTTFANNAKTAIGTKVYKDILDDTVQKN